MDLDVLSDKWQKFEAKSFPFGHRSKVVSGKNLTIFSSEVGGLILSFMNTGGWLGARQTMVVTEYVGQASQMLPELEGEARDYFQELFSMLGSVAEATDTKRH